MKTLNILVFALLLGIGALAQKPVKCTVPVIGNTYINYGKTGNVVDRSRYRHATDRSITKEGGLILPAKASRTASSYFYLTKDQKPVISLLAKGDATIEVTVNGKKNVVKLNSTDFKEYSLGKYKTNVDGYVKINYLRMTKGLAQIKSIIVENKEQPIFLSDSYSTYFGLRGPSCHLGYDTRGMGREIDWAVIDVSVPAELDRVGSYYMALGFSYGYFGFQNNSKNHRQVLFSVWNSVHADDPKDVQEAHQTRVIAYGEGVTAQNFGNEGSGKQSFKKINWLPDHTYRFLLHAERVEENTVDYSAWFYDSVTDEWHYMSTLRRPETKELLTGLHSFLENFTPEQGDVTRKAYYFNGWVKPVGGMWRPITRARLTNDATGREGIRLDFNGGAVGDKFFLTNCGYFNRAKEINRVLEIDASENVPPIIDLTQFKCPK